MRLLLVEDDTMVGEAVCQGLRQDGFTVDWVRDGRAAEIALAGSDHAMLLLDLGLPLKSGIDLLRELRQAGNRIPVLVLTARDAIADRVQGLDGGADDYLVKPFDLDELAARIRALARRVTGRVETVMRHGELTLDPGAHAATLAGRPLALSAREFALLEALLEKPGAILSRARLEEILYGWNEEVESNAVEVHIHNLRKKLGQEFIRNVRGLGYMVARRP
jgi:two-component system response regulator QseB